MKSDKLPTFHTLFIIPHSNVFPPQRTDFSSWRGIYAMIVAWISADRQQLFKTDVEGNYSVQEKGEGDYIFRTLCKRLRQKAVRYPDFVLVLSYSVR